MGEFERGTRVRGEMGEGGQVVRVKREDAGDDESSAKELTGGREVERRSGGALGCEKEGRVPKGWWGCSVFVDLERICF